MRGPWRQAEGEQSPLAAAAWLPLAPVSLAVRVGAAVHRASWERGLRTPRRLPCRVVSVGGLTVGGSGKTPLAAWVAAGLRARGQGVVVATRGHGRRHREPVIVLSDGRHAFCDGEHPGDEPLVLVAQSPGTPVIVSRDRGVAGLRAVSAFDADVLVLDDGFQHHRLARDVELVVFDGHFGVGNGRVLPRGPLREGPRVLVRADGVVVLDPPLAPRATALLERHGSGAEHFTGHRRLVGTRPLEGGAVAPIEHLAGERIGILSGVANPAGVRRSLEAVGARIVAERARGDHHQFRPRDLRGLDRRPDLWVTTEKDAVKILPSWLGGVDLRVLVMRLELPRGGELLDWLAARIAPNATGEERAAG